MSEIARFKYNDASVLVEVEDARVGRAPVGRREDGVWEATQTFKDALAHVLPAAQAIVEHLKGLSPHQIEVEFGIKLSGEAGALIAKTGAEGHFQVKLAWSEKN